LQQAVPFRIAFDVPADQMSDVGFWVDLVPFRAHAPTHCGM
jgi:hypothetical protein